MSSPTEKGLLEWHAEHLDRIQKRLGLTAYGMMWLSFAKGAAFSVVVFVLSFVVWWLLYGRKTDPHDRACA